MATVEYKDKHSGKKLKLWERIEIVVGPENDTGHYTSRFEDFESGRITLSQPQLLRGNTLLRDKADCDVLITREDAIYQFSTKIHKGKKDRQDIYYLDPPKRISRVQRRQYVRIEYMKPIWMAEVAQFLKGVEQVDWVEAKMLNISAGGLLIKTDTLFNEKEHLLLRLDLFGKLGLPLAIAAIIKYVRKEESGFVLGCEFMTTVRLEMVFTSSELNKLPESITMFDQRAQGKLVKWVFEEQLVLRNKGLL